MEPYCEKKPYVGRLLLGGHGKQTSYAKLRALHVGSWPAAMGQPLHCRLVGSLT